MNSMQRSFVNERTLLVDQHPVTLDSSCLPGIKKVLEQQRMRVQELMHLNCDAGVVYVGAPPVGFMSTPQPALSSMFFSATDAVRVHHTKDGYTLIQSPHIERSQVRLASPTGPQPHHYPISFDRWAWYVVQAAKQELHQLWDMQGGATVNASHLLELEEPGVLIRTTMHCGRFSAEYTIPLDDKGKEQLLAWFVAEKAKVVEFWKAVLLGTDTTSAHYQNARADMLEFRGPAGGDQCDVHRSNRDYERAKREKVESGTADMNDPMFMVHCCISRDEDCDCAAIAQTVLPLSETVLPQSETVLPLSET